MTTLDLDELEAPVASSRRQSGDQHLPGPLLIDAHVHLHRRVGPAALLEAAHANLARARAGLGLNADALGCLVFTDAAGEDAFGALLSSLAPSSGWRIARTGEDHSLLALKGLELRLLLIGGRQVRTREGLEVLAVGTRAAIADGEPLNVTLSAVRRFGAFPILPWGFGKWWGQRGRLMARIAHAAEPGTLALGDNAGRPRAAPRPYPFRQALKRGLPVLPGSDPLPLGGHTARAGSFGFVLNGPFERAQPARAICRRLETLGHQPRVFGACAALGRVALDQLAPRRRPAARLMLHHDTITPDVETASPGYASRFAGPVGRFFLDVQRRHVMHLLGAQPGERLRILEVGGGHGQLTPALLEAGHEVWVQGSAAACREPLEPLFEAHLERLHFVAASLFDLPFEDGAFDAVVAVRLLAHVDRPEALLLEMARVSRRTLVVDFPPLISANLLEPVLFHVKRRLEGNTRPFFSYRTGDLQAPLRATGFTRFRTAKQFFLPMVVHRKAGTPGLSARLEHLCRRLGLTRLLGAPVLLAAERAPQPVAEV